MLKIKNSYVCIAPSKELFNVNGKSLGMSGERALYYSSDLGKHRVYRSAYPKEPYYFNGTDINANLKLFKFNSFWRALKLCHEINKHYGDNFKVKEIK